MPQSGSRRPWAEDELVKVLSLYCQVPFGQMHSRNPLVIQFAGELTRSPASIALKLVNFASFDPALQARGIRGMANASHLDREVWARFYGKWEMLAAAEPAERVASEQWTQRPTAAERTVAVRLGQGFFRNAVLSAYDGSCCITGIRATSLLRASHIIPWSVSEPHRLDPSNGLCLNALHDAAFDAGLIGLDSELRIIVSSSAAGAMPAEAYSEYFTRHDGRSIRFPERFRPDDSCLRYHRENIFIS